MAFRDYKARWFRKGTGAAVTLDNVIQINAVRQLDAEKNSCEITLDYVSENVLDGGEIKYKADDIIKIYATEGNVDFNQSDHLLGTYVIQNYDITPDGRQLKLILADKTYIMLSQIIVIPTGTKKVNEHIENIIQTANEDGTSITLISTNIDSTTSTGGDFPSVEYATVYKTAYEAIAELSQQEYTGDDRAYKFYYDENDNFFWEYPGQTPEAQEFFYGEEPINTMKIQRRESEAISMIIYDAGLDKNDNQRVFFYLDNNASSLDKSRIRYFPMIDISKQLKKFLTDEGTYAGLSNDDYIELLDKAAVGRAQRIMDKVGTGLWESIIDINGIKYTPGKLYPVKSETYGFPLTNLRLERVSHSMDKNGWSTKLTLVEDPEALEL